MLDNLRSQTSFQPDEEEPPESFEPEKPKRIPMKPRRPGRSLDQITRMKAPQRFTLALLLFIAVCLVGTALLVLAGKVALPIGF